MSAQIGQQLRALADSAQAAAGYLGLDDERIEAILRRAEELSESWSGSNLGYHANVYYEGMKRTPPGARFSSEWGLQQSFAAGTDGSWREYDSKEIEVYCMSAAPALNLEEVNDRAIEAKRTFEDGKSRFESIISIVLQGRVDEYLHRLHEQVNELTVLSVDTGVRAQLPTGSIGSRDYIAINAGLRPAPHQFVIAKMVALRSPHQCLAELATLARRTADHYDLSIGAVMTRLVPTGSKIFIGHGRSADWRELKDFIQDRLGLVWDEFNRVPIAGIANTARLQNMLEDAGFAFLIMTAEDEQADGTVRARENVVHEAGLFQGRLGFTKAILVLEEGCEEFSNIHGLGQIRFAPGKIKAVFEDVRMLLEREGILNPSKN